MGRTEVIATERHQAIADRELGPIAAERGVDVVDLILDLALEEDLATQFRTALVNTDEDAVAKLLASDDTLLGLSDAGAHAGQPLRCRLLERNLLGHWVRERKDLVRWSARSACSPASPPTSSASPSADGSWPGGFADVVVFDPDSVAALPLERVRDLPGGADRLISKARGIEHVLVNGQPIHSTQLPAGAALPGRLLRHGRALER